MPPSDFFPKFPRKVVGLGLSRTGTMALHEHSKALGLLSEHYLIGLFAHEDRLFNINSTAAIKFRPLLSYRLNRARSYHLYEDTHKKLHDYTALFDLPTPLYVEKLVEIHPNACFIYTYRSVERWLESMKWLFQEGRYLWRFNDLDLQLLNAVYGCTTYNRNELIISRRKYEKRLNAIFSNGRFDYHQIDSDEREISSEQLASILNIDISKNVVLDKNKRYNGRRSVGFGEKLDYQMARCVPGYGTISAIKNTLIKKV